MDLTDIVSKYGQMLLLVPPIAFFVVRTIIVPLLNLAYKWGHLEAEIDQMRRELSDIKKSLKKKNKINGRMVN